MKILENLSTLQQRILSALVLLGIGGGFFYDLLNGGSTDFASVVLWLFGFGLLYELFSINRGSSWKARGVTALAGGIYFIAFVALYQAVQIPFLFAPFLIVLLLVTVSTDIGAYAIGRKFGHQYLSGKLAPAISPNKTWMGFVGGVVSAGLLGGVLSVFMHQSDPFAIAVSSNAYAIAFLNGFLLFVVGSVIAQIGDLFESYLKRLNDVKDTSNLIPGHGGLLDRFDSFLFLLFCVFLFQYLGVF